MEKNRCGAVRKSFFILLFLTLFMSCSTGRVDREQSSTTEAKLKEVQHPATKHIQTTRSAFSTNLASYIASPEQMEICGEPVPLDNQEVWERFDKEFTIIVYNNSQVFLWLKRMKRDFPWIEKHLQMLALPDDLKYLIVEESDLLPRTWLAKIGIMRSTGPNSPPTGYTQHDYEEAVENIFFRLKALRAQFPNWTLTIAAYYCGLKQMQAAMAEQNTTDFYSMELPDASDRNFFRILAIKAALSHPERYGYILPTAAGY